MAPRAFAFKSVADVRALEDGRVVAGWLYMTHEADSRGPDGQIVKGAQVVDHSGDVIAQADLRAGMHALFLNGGLEAVDVEHDGVPVARVVGAVTITDDTLKAMAGGADVVGLPRGAWVELLVSEEIYKRVRSGELAMLSLAGTCTVEPIEAGE